jgi:hypothetical protein
MLLTLTAAERRGIRPHCESIDIFYKKQVYNIVAKRDIWRSYGGKITIKTEKTRVAMEIGHRRFYDVLLEDKAYEDSLYGTFDWAIRKFPKGGGADSGKTLCVWPAVGPRRDRGLSPLRLRRWRTKTRGTTPPGS